MRRDTRAAFRSRAAATEGMIDEAVAAVRQARDAEFEAQKALAAIRNIPVPFTDEQYASAKAIRTKLGWFKVVRVNAQSVAVETGYSWTDRIARTKILEVQ